MPCITAEAFHAGCRDVGQRYLAGTLAPGGPTRYGLTGCTDCFSPAKLELPLQFTSSNAVHAMGADAVKAASPLAGRARVRTGGTTTTHRRPPPQAAAAPHAKRLRNQGQKGELRELNPRPLLP